MTDRDPHRLPTAFAVTMCFVLVIIGIAFQTWIWQRDVDTHDACTQDWGQQMTEVLDARTQASTALSQAERDRDSALDALLEQAIFRSRAENATPAQQRNFQRRIERLVDQYLAAIEKVRKKAETATNVRAKNPFPELHC